MMTRPSVNRGLGWGYNLLSKYSTNADALRFAGEQWLFSISVVSRVLINYVVS